MSSAKFVYYLYLIESFKNNLLLFVLRMLKLSDVYLE